jgi:hypothetical protein
VALSQVSEVVDNFSEDTSIGAQSHAQVGRIGLESCGYAFALQSLSLRDYVLLDNQSLVHVFCNPDLVGNVRKAGRQLELESNGGNFLSHPLQM